MRSQTSALRQVTALASPTELRKRGRPARAREFEHGRELISVICNSWIRTRVDIGGEGEATLISICGEIDLRNAPQTRSDLLEIARQADQPLVVDLTETSFLDCRGLDALAATRDALQAHGKTLHLHGARGIVRRALALSDLVDLLEEPSG